VVEDAMCMCVCVCVCVCILMGCVIKLLPFCLSICKETQRFLYCRTGKNRGQSGRRTESSCNNWPHILLSGREHCE
jgi:hypothetical protein